VKVAVTSKGPTIDDNVDPRFGRCAFFAVFDTDDMSNRIFENTSAQLGGGAGVRSAQLVSEAGVEVVLTGKCGPKAEQALSAAGIRVVSDTSGSVRSAVEAFAGRGGEK
jgi:predicted Fe-Mo cluster-binding NifX family protein